MSTLKFVVILYFLFQVCGNRHIPVHRFVLAARSPVFKANFEHATTNEEEKGEIVIEDNDYESILNLVRCFDQNHFTVI